MMSRLREAIQFCKGAEGLEEWKSDYKMPYEHRMQMERCLIKNYLIPKGMDYFGKRDLIYLDMSGTDDVVRLAGHNPDLSGLFPGKEN